MDARELQAPENGLDSEWECPDCSVEMTAVACGDAEFKVSPHFRAVGQHEEDCEHDGRRKLVKSGSIQNIQKSIGKPYDMPSILRLLEERPQRPSPASNEEPKESVDSYRGIGRDGLVKSPHQSIASTIYRIAEAYCIYPSERERQLRVPDCEGNSYATCFYELKKSTGFVNLTRRIMFAPIRFRTPNCQSKTITFELAPAVWPLQRDNPENRRPLKNYGISIDTEEWTEHSRKLFETELINSVQKQKENYHNGYQHKTYVFFLGQQQESDLVSFLVSSRQLVCFLDLHKDVYTQL